MLERERMAPEHTANSTFSVSPYQDLLRAGARLRPLQQVHAHLIVTGQHRSLSLLTKLVSLACACGAIPYTRKLLLFSIPNPDSYLFNTLIRISSKLSLPYDAVFFYHRMLLCSFPPSNYTFTSLIKACAGVSTLRLGKILHCHVYAFGFGWDPYVQTALLAFYAKCGELGVARNLFDEMPVRRVIAWNALISGYEQNGLARESVELFESMLVQGTEPDSVTFVSVLAACAELGALDLGCWIHNHVLNNNIEVNVVLGTALINMYTRCGDVKKAREVFDLMAEKNVVAWTAMISGYGIHGYGHEALEIFHQMKAIGPRPNEITFVSILSACAHAGLVNEGRKVLSCMKKNYGLWPCIEHHVCMVDMLGRAGLLDEAFSYVKNIKPPSAAVYTAMLSACKMHKKTELGVEVAEHLLAIEPENAGHYVMLSNIYALAGRMERVESVRNRMIRRGLKKQVGYSTIEVDRKTHLFRMGDKSHPETKQIYKYLDELMGRIAEAGYVPAQESVLHELEEEEREYALRYHSEKLAVAFGLLKASHGSGTAIRIAKNLRMCEDCHLAIKFISVVVDREIIIRDKLRFHHFKDGVCSCADYW